MNRQLLAFTLGLDMFDQAFVDAMSLPLDPDILA